MSKHCMSFRIPVVAGALLVLLMLWGVLTATARSELARGVDSPWLADTEGVAASVTLTATWSYTYYFPIAFRAYMAPVWTRVGPSGIKVRDLVVDPKRPNRLYIGTSEHGIYRSTDGGSTWEEINQGLPISPTANALAINPITPTNLYAGVAYPPNFYRSVDGGNNWQGGEELLFRVMVVAVDPLSPHVLYAGTAQGIDTRSGGCVYKSQNAGASWVWILPDLTNARIIVVDPVTPTIVYAGTGSMGLIKSVDGGAHWASVQDGQGHDLGWVHDIALDPDDHNVLYTATADKVLKSLDGGEHWVEISNGLPNGPVYGLTFAPTASGTVYIGMRTPECDTPTCGGAIYKSTNGGADWVSTGRILSDNRIQVMAVDPFDPEVLYVGTDGDGVWRYGPPSGCTRDSVRGESK